jgi:hypothetical protein
MSSMLDALTGPPGAGGGAPPVPPPGGPAGPGGPGLAALLGPGPGGPPPPDLDAGRHPDDVYDTSMQALDVAEHALQAFVRMDHDAPDKALAAKALAIVTQIKGGHQSDAQKGGGKSLIRAIGGAPGLPGLA